MDFLILVVFISMMLGALSILEAMSDFLCKHSEFFNGLFWSAERRIFGNEYDEEDDLYE